MIEIFKNIIDEMREDGLSCHITYGHKWLQSNQGVKLNEVSFLFDPQKYRFEKMNKEKFCNVSFIVAYPVNQNQTDVNKTISLENDIEQYVLRFLARVFEYTYFKDFSDVEIEAFHDSTLFEIAAQGFVVRFSFRHMLQTFCK